MRCPDCGATVQGVETNAPGAHAFDPCGCSATALTASDLATLDRGHGLATDGGREMAKWECGGCGDSFETPGEPELACLKCGTDDWQEVDAE